MFSVGSVEGIPFTACTSGSDIIILASNFFRVQQITVNSSVNSLDCSTDVGKIAAAHENIISIFEPLPQNQQHLATQQHQQLLPASNSTKLDYKWIQTATLEPGAPISVLSFNLEGTRLVTACGETLRLWFADANSKSTWHSVWQCETANYIHYLKYSPDGALFCSAGKFDRLVKVWFECITLAEINNSNNNRQLTQPQQQQKQATSASNYSNGNEPSPTSLSSVELSFTYLAHPSPVTRLEWRLTCKYMPKGAIANILLTSCEDNRARIWVQTHLSDVCVRSNFQLAMSIEQEEVAGFQSQFVVHWINNKEIHITRSIEFLLRGMLMRVLKGNNPASSSTSSIHSENDTDTNADDNNDDTITAEQSKKLRHKLCRKINKQRAMAASGRRDPGLELDDRTNANSLYQNSGRTSPTSLVEEFDRTLESLLKKWQLSNDLLFSINKLDGKLTLWQVKYLDGDETGANRPVTYEKVSHLNSALPHYDATTMSLNITAYSPSAYLDVKRAYLAVTKPSALVTTNDESTTTVTEDQLPEVLSIQSESSLKPGGSSYEGKGSESLNSVGDQEPSIFMVTQHLSGILSLWKLNFDATYPKVRNIDLVTRITGLPIDPAWLKDGTLIVEYINMDSALITRWLADEPGTKTALKTSKSTFSPSWAMKNAPYNFEDIKSSLSRNLPSVDEDMTLKPIMGLDESQTEHKESYKASQMASVVNILPQYHLKQLIELLAFGKLQKVKAILNNLVNCLVSSESSHDRDNDTATPSTRWPHRSRTLSVVAQSAPSFHDSFDIENPSSTIQQQVIEEIELDYIEATSIRPLPLYSLLKADSEKKNSNPDSKSSAHEEFIGGYESIMKSRTMVDETLDEILGQSTIEIINKQKEMSRLASDSANESLTSFNPRKAKLLTSVLTHTHLPGLSNLDQMHLLAVADAVALFDASPEDYNDLQDEDQDTHGGISTNIAIDSLDDRGLRFLTAMRQYVYLSRFLPAKQRSELRIEGIGNHNVIWAFHSESQDELISLIPCVQRNKPIWNELREFGLGWWCKKLEVLRKLIEKVAQSAFQARQDPLDAALFYLAMKKKTLVCALLRRVNCDKRLLKLFEQDFKDPVNRKKALKNAYALLGLHRFEHAAAFFILAGSIWDAVEVCINNLNDIQLAMVLIRLHDNDSNLPSNLKRLLFTEVLGSKRPSTEPAAQNQVGAVGGIGYDSAERRTSGAGMQYSYDPKRAHPDPFLRSMAFWKLGDYLSAVHTLLESDVGCQKQRKSSIAHQSSASSRRNSDALTRNQTGPAGSSNPSSHHASNPASGQLSPTESNGIVAAGKTGNVSVSASVFNFYLFLKDQPLVTKHRNQLMEEIEIKKRTSPVEEEQVHCHRARSLSSGEISFDERGVHRAIKQSSTEYEVLNETIRLVDKYSDEAIAEKERKLFFSTAQAYLEAGCPLLALEVLCSEDHLNMSKAQRMKFVACLHIILNDLNTLASSHHVASGTTNKKFSNQFHEWLRQNLEALGEICSYSGVRVNKDHGVEQPSNEAGETSGAAAAAVASSSTSKASSHHEHTLARTKSAPVSRDTDSTSGASISFDQTQVDAAALADVDLMWVESNEPILRTMLTYCNLRSATENSLTTIRLELLGLLRKLATSAMSTKT